MPHSTKKKKAWKNRILLKEIIMSDGFKLGFWLYEWNDEVVSKLGHDRCLRILKRKPDGHVLMTEQIGIRVDNWSTFVKVINGLRISEYMKIPSKIEDK